MLDGPSTRVLVYLQVAADAGLSREALIRGLLPDGPLPARVPFDVMTTLLDRMAHLLGGPPALEEACARYAEPPDLAYLANVFDSQRLFSRFVCEKVSAVNYPFAHTTHEDLPGGRYRETMVFPPGVRSGIACGHALVGFVRGHARLRGLPENNVQVVCLDGRRTTFIVTPPAESPVRVVGRSPTAAADHSDAAALRALVADRASFARQRVRFAAAVEALTAPALCHAPMEEFLARSCEIVGDVVESEHCAIWAAAAVQPAGTPRLLAWAGAPPPWPSGQRVALCDGYVMEVGAGADLTLARPLFGWLARRLLPTSPLPRTSAEERAEAWRLTPRQRDVLGLLALGLGNRDMAARLGCTVGTVEQHVSAVLERSGLTTRAAVLRACAHSSTAGPRHGR